MSATPRPWRVHHWAEGGLSIRNAVRQPARDRVYICNMCNGANNADAELIVRAVNAHDDLVAACAEFVRKCECGEARSVRSYAQMKAALAKARGEA